VVSCTIPFEPLCTVYVLMFGHLKKWARTIKRDTHALYLAAGDPRVPWYAKAIAAGVAAYAISPIDLIPDFIPVIGYLDDLVIVPLGILLAVKMIPGEVMAEHRAAADVASRLPTSKAAAIAIITLWILSIGMVAWFAAGYFNRN
jgi:uncharacterized membrane protein YkvA (DUF1232 family)